MNKILDFIIKEMRSFPNNKGLKFKYIDFPDTVICIYKNKKNEFLCIKQYRPIFNDFFIEFPGGSVEKGETIEECGIREFMEETGYIPVQVEKLATVIPSIGMSTEKIHILLIKSIKAEILEVKESDISVEWFDSMSLLKMINTGEISDAKTIIGTYMTKDEKF